MRDPQLGDMVIYCDHPKRKGDPVGKDKAAVVIQLPGDGVTADLCVLNPPGHAVAYQRHRNVKHHEPAANELPTIGTWRFGEWKP